MQSTGILAKLRLERKRVRYSLLGASFILKIAHIDNGHDFRGGQDLLLSLARGLKQRGHRQAIVCPEGSPLAQRAATEKQEVIPVGRVGRLRSLLREQHFDIVHAHDAKAQTISFLASFGLPVRRIASRQVAFPPRNPLIHRWKYSRTCHGVIALSQSVRQVLIEAGVPDSKIIAMHGQDGIHLLERLREVSFFGDWERAVADAGITELKEGGYSIAVAVNDRDEALHIANIATPYGAHSFNYFGPLMNEQLTK